MENLVTKDGRILNPTLSTYLIPTIWDIPREVKSVILEYADPRGPWGARGMAEMPFIAVASALHHALREATGVWYNRFPFNAERVLRGLKGRS
mgnify:CR=1 FL=1